MKKIYSIVVLILIISFITLYYIQTSNKIGINKNATQIQSSNFSTNQTKCDELLELESIEFKRLNMSCRVNEDCVLIPVRCGLCVNKDTDVTRYIEIYSLMMREGCVPIVDCLRVECTCLNNKCETKRLAIE
jgi:hypothetical protein